MGMLREVMTTRLRLCESGGHATSVYHTPLLLTFIDDARFSRHSIALLRNAAAASGRFS